MRAASGVAVPIQHRFDNVVDARGFGQYWFRNIEWEQDQIVKKVLAIKCIRVYLFEIRESDILYLRDQKIVAESVKMSHKHHFGLEWKHTSPAEYQCNRIRDERIVDTVCTHALILFLFRCTSLVDSVIDPTEAHTNPTTPHIEGQLQRATFIISIQKGKQDQLRRPTHDISIRHNPPSYEHPSSQLEDSDIRNSSKSKLKSNESSKEAAKPISVVLLGAGGVGKSAITIQFVKDKFVEQYDPIVVDGKVQMMTIWDTAGQEEYRALQDGYIRDASGFVIVYSVIDQTSFCDIRKLYERILRIRDCERVPAVLLGNKVDMEVDREVTAAEAKQLADEYHMDFQETSAKNKTGVEQSFHQLVRAIRLANEEQTPGRSNKKK
ncbi:ras-related protein Rap-2b-like [Planoprotostelium fungivorum]|uniref:Ras-related protein Rap-2b-like n=1 Tax=Planoprotostelium fungivorum TaxID=1890364 RepID=A0A2P6NI74_9EUKA|nr:ras-related protein Rap-2b-like [Planoprotostelium fungivorum]